jgi:hypothetical protein
VHALTESRRQELGGTEIQACVVAPATVDTPLFQHAANYTGRPVEAMKPIYPAERVAEALVACAKRPQREVLVGGMPRISSLMQVFFPGVFERQMPKMVAKDHLGEGSAPKDCGNVLEPVGPHSIHGGWRAAKGATAIGKWGPLLAIPLALLPIAFGMRALGR